MQNKYPKRSNRNRKNHGLPAKTSVGAAVFFAIYGLPHAAFAQQADAAAGQLEEITVTANRRTQTLEEVPYSMSVVSADQLVQMGVTDIASLATTVPGLSMYDFGARFAGAVSPIIRGIECNRRANAGFSKFRTKPSGNVYRQFSHRRLFPIG